MPALIDIINDRQKSGKSKLSQDYAMTCADVGGMAFYADSCAALEKTDEKEQISWWRICSVSMDREGDILVPKGCLGSIKSYVDNPVVCYDHKRAYPLPIGTSVGKSGLPIDAKESEIIAGCKHDDTTQFARDVCRLVFKKVLRGASISFVPLSGERVTASKAHNSAEGKSFTPRFRFTNWNLTEWSICATGINPEAVRIELSCGGIKSPEMIKSLSPLAQVPKVWANGFTPEEDADMTVAAQIPVNAVHSIRFHKSKFETADTCRTWLLEKSLDSSVLAENPKSYDFTQQVIDPSEFTIKLDDGVYGVLAKGFEDLKKKKKKPAALEVADDEEADDAEAPPAPAKKPMPGAKPAAKPGLGAKPPMPGAAPAPKKPAPFGNGPDEASGIDEDEDLDPDAVDAEEETGLDEEVPDDMGVPPTGAGPMKMGKPMQPSAADAAAGAGVNAMGGAMTHAGQAFVDVLKHKKAELEYYRQSLQVHDHDNLKKLMQQEVQNCEARYHIWMTYAQGAFPGVDFEGASALEPDMNDNQNPMDDNAASLDDEADPLQKSLKTLTDDQWEDLAIQMALAK